MELRCQQGSSSLLITQFLASCWLWLIPCTTALRSGSDLIETRIASNGGAKLQGSSRSRLDRDGHWLVLIRHAESVNNIREAGTAKQANPDLTNLGYEQAAAVGQLTIPEVENSVFVASAFKRAVLTMKPLAAKYAKDVHIDPNLGEKGGAVGEKPCASEEEMSDHSFQRNGHVDANKNKNEKAEKLVMCEDITNGDNMTAIAAALGDVKAQLYNDPFTGQPVELPYAMRDTGWYSLGRKESKKELQMRAEIVAKRLKAELQNRTVVMVTHGWFIVYLLRDVLQMQDLPMNVLRENVRHDNVGVTRIFFPCSVASNGDGDVDSTAGLLLRRKVEAEAPRAAENLAAERPEVAAAADALGIIVEALSKPAMAGNVGIMD